MPLGRAFLFLLALCPAVLEGCMASSVPEKKIRTEIVELDFNQVKQGMHDGSLIYMDVRNRSEMETDGRIVGSYVVPLPEIEEALQMTDEAFQRKYCFSKPKLDMSNIVVACKSGRRAVNAVNKLQEMGYTSMNLYRGSFLDWKANNGPILKEPVQEC